MTYTDEEIKNLDDSLARNDCRLVRTAVSFSLFENRFSRDFGLTTEDVKSAKYLYRQVVLGETISANFFFGLSSSLTRLLTSTEKWVKILDNHLKEQEDDPYNVYYSSFFSFASYYGYMIVMQWLWALAPKSRQQNMLEAVSFCAFRQACAHGHFEMACWLWNLVHKSEVKSWQQNMSEAVYFDAFRLACANGHFKVAQWLWALASGSHQQQNMLEDSRFCVFRQACANGHFKVTQWLWDLAPKSRQPNMLEARDFYAFRGACANGHFEIAQWLWALASKSRQPSMLEADSFNAFALACKNGHFEIARWLWALASKSYQQQNMLEAYGFGAFALACKNGHFEIVQWLWTVTLENLKFEMFNSAHCCAFRLACENGHLRVAQWLWSKAAPENSFCSQKRVLEHHDFYAFRRACARGHFEMAQWLLAVVSEDLKLKMLEAGASYAFRLACENGHLQVAQWLWDLIPEARHQGMFENGSIVNLWYRCGDENCGQDYPEIETEIDSCYAFRGAYKKGHYETARWLCSVYLPLACSNEPAQFNRIKDTPRHIFLEAIRDILLKQRNFVDTLQAQQGYMILKGLICYAHEIDNVYDAIERLLQAPDILVLVKRFITATERNICNEPNEILHLAKKQKPCFEQLLLRYVPEFKACVFIELNSTFFNEISKNSKATIAGASLKTGVQLNFIKKGFGTQLYQWTENKFERFKVWLATTYVEL